MIYRISVFLLILMVIPSMIFAWGLEPVSLGERDAAEQIGAAEQGGLGAEEDQKRIPPRSLEGTVDPDTYILGPRDKLLLVIGRPDNTTIQLQVLPEGAVILPNIGPYQAAGLTLSDFKSRVSKELGRYYRNVDIDCMLAQPRAFVVFVLGEVNDPGPVELYAPFRLSRALDEAGGVTSKGSLRQIEIREKDRVIRNVDLFLFTAFGDFSENPMLKEGQSILVPPKRKIVKVLGEVQIAGNYELLEGETAKDLLTYCGGLTALADEERILIERINGRDSVLTITSTLDEIEKVHLQDRDVLVVPDILSFSQSRVVEVVGGGGRSGRFLIQRGETLKDFLPRLWRFSERHATAEVVLERGTKNGDVEHILFDPVKAMEGDPVGNIVLRSGDLINATPAQRSVFVAGEVGQPGEYQFRADHRAKEYIGLAGGITGSGSFDRLVIFSEEGTERDADKNSEVYRGETILVKKRKSVMLWSAITGLGSLTGLLLAVIAITK